MTQIDPVRKIPKDFLGNFSEYTTWELNQASEDELNLLFQVSDEVWSVRSDEGVPLLIAGVIPGTMLGRAPELWIMLCKELEQRPRRYIREVGYLVQRLREIYPRMRTKLEDRRPQCRFAEFFGFRPTGCWEQNYMIFEV